MKFSRCFKTVEGRSCAFAVTAAYQKVGNDRWETGLDEEVREIRDENKERMLHLLIQKIENRKSKPSVRFHFEEGMSYEEKIQVGE